MTILNWLLCTRFFVCAFFFFYYHRISTLQCLWHCIFQDHQILFDLVFLSVNKYPSIQHTNSTKTNRFIFLDSLHRIGFGHHIKQMKPLMKTNIRNNHSIFEFYLISFRLCRRFESVYNTVLELKKKKQFRFYRIKFSFSFDFKNIAIVCPLNQKLK